MCVDRRAGRISATAVVVRGKGLGGQLPDTDPGTACEGQKVVNPAAIKSWKGIEQDHQTAQIL